MRIPIVITEKEYNKSEKLFQALNSKYEWVISKPDELSVAKMIEKSKATIVVVGVRSYEKELYEAIKKNGDMNSSNIIGKKGLIIRYGVGHDGINKETCSNSGILLVNTPGALDESVAEHSISLLVSMLRNIPKLDQQMRDNEYISLMGKELYGKKIGIAGFGNIGKRIAQIAFYGFRAQIVAFDKIPLEKQAKKLGLTSKAFLEKYGLKDYYENYSEFAKSLDILTINMPVTDDTKNFFNKDRLQKLKQGCFIVNTSRGSLICESALYDLLENGHISCAALDVYKEEPYVPMDPNRDLRSMENTVLTPHVASNTDESNRRIVQMIEKNICYYLDGNIEDMNTVIQN